MPIGNYIKACERNVGGNLYVFVTEASNVFDVTVTNGEVSEIEMFYIEEFKQIQADTYGIVRQCREKGEGPDKAYYEHLVDFTCSNARTALNVLANSLSEASPCGMLAIVMDGNGQGWLIGWSDQDKGNRPLYLRIDDFTSGKDPVQPEGGKRLFELFGTSVFLDLPLDATLNAYINTQLMGALGNAIGLPFTGGGGFSPEYLAVYDSWTTKPSGAVADQQDIMARADVAAGIWTKRDIRYVFAAHTNDNGEALTNWFNPGTFDATMVNAPTFVAFEGFTGDGATSYIRSNWIPSSDGINYVQDSASMGLYCRTDNANAERDMGVFDGTYNAQLITQFNDNKAYYWSNNAVAANTANADSKGMYIGTRVDSTDQDLYRNKAVLFDRSDASTGVPTKELFFLGHNNNGAIQNPSTRQLSGGLAGSGYIQQNVDDETDNFEVYMDSNGKGVIP